MEAPTADSVATATAALAIDSSLPLWFKPELFLEPDFSPTAYFSDLKRYVSRFAPPEQLPRRSPLLLGGCARESTSLPMGESEGAGAAHLACRRRAAAATDRRSAACCRCRWRP